MNTALRMRLIPLSKRLTATHSARLQSIIFSRRTIHSTNIACKDYPDHTLLPMPALSPTMEMGTISEWALKEGDSFTAGSVICSVETDKATMDFESQDDGFLAKILRDGPTASDIAIGVPIAVVVEDEEDVAAFADFVLETEDAAPADSVPETATPSAATTSDTGPTPERQVADEDVLLPSARFLAESKSVPFLVFLSF